jgi:hypothetical protein
VPPASAAGPAGAAAGPAGAGAGATAATAFPAAAAGVRAGRPGDSPPGAAPGEAPTGVTGLDPAARAGEAAGPAEPARRDALADDATHLTQLDPVARAGGAGGVARRDGTTGDATHLTQLDPAAAGAAGVASPAAGATQATRVVPGALGVPRNGNGTGNGTGNGAGHPPGDGSAGPGDGRTIVGARPGPTFWYGGAEHDSAATLAAAMQRTWDDAVDQLFVRRNPVWVADLQAFLDARGLADAERIVAYGQGTSPAGAAMARFLVALDPELEPRFGGILLTPAGLASAANAVLAGHGPAARLAEVHDDDVLRLWRMLPGLEEAAAIDERWQAHTQAFDRLAAEVSADAGEPTPADRQQAMARLLLYALGGRHARQQTRRLRSAQKTPAAEVTWWQRLANRGGAVPAAAVLAVMTVEAARPAGEAIRRRNEEVAAEAARRAEQARQAEAARRAAAPPAPPGPYAPAPPWAGGPPAGPAADRPPPPVAAAAGRWAPRKKAHGLARRPFGLAVVVAVLGFHLWAFPYLRDELRLYFEVDPAGALDLGVEALDEIEQGTAFVAFALVLAIGMHLAGRWADKGQRSAAIRLYALGAAATDAIVAFAMFSTCWFAALVVQVAADGSSSDPRLPAELVRPAWGGLGVTHTVVFFLALWVLVRAVVRGLRALLGGPVAQRVG